MVELTKRQAIEEVASELFREHGYAGTSIRDIARALSVQGASLYAHVTSKEDVLWAIVDRAATRFEAAADVAEASTDARRPGDPGEALAALVRAHFVHEWRALGLEHRADILARRDAYEARFRRRIEDGIAVGAFAMTDPGVATSTVLSALNGVAGWYDPSGRLSAGRIADHLVELTLRMVSNP
jgi:TetR/AcrR family transcriptional regulator, cholesterol catabolism regulator